MGGIVDLYISFSRTICFAYSSRKASGDIGSVIPSSNATEAAKREYMGGWGMRIRRRAGMGNDCPAGKDSSATSNMQPEYRRTQRIPCQVRLTRSRYPVWLTSFISASGRWSSFNRSYGRMFGIWNVGHRMCVCGRGERERGDVAVPNYVGSREAYECIWKSGLFRCGGICHCSQSRGSCMTVTKRNDQLK